MEKQDKGLSREAGGKEGDEMKPRQHAPLERMKTSRNYWLELDCTILLPGECQHRDSKAGTPGGW